MQVQLTVRKAYIFNTFQTVLCKAIRILSELYLDEIYFLQLYFTIQVSLRFCQISKDEFTNTGSEESWTSNNSTTIISCPPICSNSQWCPASTFLSQ